ncbi:hypothetical protein GGD56_000106 [Rhizobium mongolense]|jgi:hypothetical protein|uniref:Uncharacterized protein n=1 Tax=Rhizobium mongolense TaxID=57676 RepID=A0ABR6IEK5_9HYPH|nr:hypothetical protein [Rhizobium mongolense]
MKAIFPDMTGRQVAIFLIETSLVMAGLVVILIVGIPML